MRTGVAKEFEIVGKPPRVVVLDDEYMNAVEEWEEDWISDDDHDQWEDVHDFGSLGVPLSKPTYSAVLKG